MKNLTFYPKTIELTHIDWQQVDSITNPDLRLFFMEAKSCLADFFPSMKENPAPEDSSYTEIGDLFSKKIPLYLPELLSADIVFKYLYDHWPLWCKLSRMAALFHDTCLRLFEQNGNWLNDWYSCRREDRRIKFGVSSWFEEMMIMVPTNRQLSLHTCAEESRYWHDLTKRLSVLEERRNERGL